MKNVLLPDDTAVLKGVGIICIVLHNFCHWLPGCALENEYVFYAGRVSRFVDMMVHGSDVVLNIFSFAGHYGVSIFLFVSGYGLVRKYETLSENVGILPFLWYNVKKLWWLLGLGMLLWFASDMYLHHWHWAHHWYNVVQMLTFTGNLFPGADLLLGPWWYFSLTMQLYVVYRVFLYKQGWIPLGIVSTLCVGALMLAVHLNDMELLNYLRYNFVGSMLPFAMGITLARTQRLYYDVTYALICLVVWIACWFEPMSWIAAPIFIVFAVMPLVDMKGTVRAAMIWTGHLSAFLFVVHPIVRPYFINSVNAGGNRYLNLVLYLLCSFLLALVYRRVTNWAKRWLQIKCMG